MPAARRLSLSIAVVFLAPTLSFAADAFTPPPIKVADGFTIELAAAPPLVKYPMMACLDERGRMFIAGTSGNNLEKAELLKQRGRFIRMLEDTDGDGRFDKSSIFADKLVMPEGALWHRNSLYVLSSPYLWRFEDTDDDGVADVREKLIGYMEFNGKANQHGAYLGPNGRIYFSGGIFGYDLKSSDGKPVAKGSAAGVFSCRIDGKDLQVFGNGGINPVEVAFTPEGELLTTCAIFDGVGGRHDALIHWVRGSTAAPKDYRPPVLAQTGYRLPPLRRWGQVAPSGLMRYRGVSFGKKYANTFFAAHFNTGEVVNTRLVRSGSTFRGYDEVFVSSTSPDFHPTDIFEDADGSLLLIDTGGWFRISCPESKVAKPKILGAIYRIRKKGAAIVKNPRGREIDWPFAAPHELAARLDDPRSAVRDRAIEALALHRDKRASTAALAGAMSSDSVQRRRNAVWSLSRIASNAARELIRTALNDPDLTVRQAAARSCGVLRDRRAVPELIQLLQSSPPPLRRASATALGQIGTGDAVPALLKSCAAGGDDHLKHALIYALIEIEDFGATAAGLRSSNPQVQYAALIALQRMAPDKLTRRHVAPLLQTDDALLKRAALEIVASRKGWSLQILGILRSWLDGKSGIPELESIAQGAVVSFSDDQRVQVMVAGALRSPKIQAKTRVALLHSVGRVKRLPADWAKAIGEILLSKDEPLARAAIAASAMSPSTELMAPLEKLARDEEASESLRSAAWACLAGKGATLPAPAFSNLLEEATDNNVAPLERVAAARALSGAKLAQSQLDQIADRLAVAGPLESPTMIQTLVEADAISAGAARSFVSALKKSPLANSLVQPAQIERLLKNHPNQRQTALGLIRKADDESTKHLRRTAKSLVAGDAARGKAVFFGNRAACSACHSANGVGGSIGPDLSRIGKIRQPMDLLESILLPSRTIVNNFETYSVITKDGRVHEGVIQQATNRRLILRNAQRDEVIIERGEVEEMARSKNSIMPKGLDRSLTIQQLSDLVVYLKSLDGNREGVKK